MESSLTIKSKSDTQGKLIGKLFIDLVHQSYNSVGWIVGYSWWYHFISQNLLRLREYASCSTIIVLELHQLGTIFRNFNDM